jgi:hypothetical protein
VSKKKGRWEAKVMLNRKWAYRYGVLCLVQRIAPHTTRSVIYVLAAAPRPQLLMAPPHNNNSCWSA